MWQWTRDARYLPAGGLDDLTIIIQRERARETRGTTTYQGSWSTYEEVGQPVIQTETGDNVSVDGGVYPWPTSDLLSAEALAAAVGDNPTVCTLEAFDQISTITLSGEYTTAAFIANTVKYVPDFASADTIFGTPWHSLTVWGSDDNLKISTRREDIYSSRHGPSWLTMWSEKTKPPTPPRRRAGG